MQIIIVLLLFEMMSSITTQFDSGTTISTQSTISSTTDPCVVSDFDVNIESGAFSIFLSWPDYNCPDRKYYIYRNYSLIDTTNGTNFTISNLEPCSVYRIDIMTERTEIIFTDNIRTIPPIPFNYTVDDLQLEQINTSLKASWKSPDIVSNCITSFNVAISNNSMSTEENSIEIDLSGYIDCEEVSIEVTPVVNQTISGLSNEKSYPVRLPPKTPSISVEHVDHNTASLQWYPESGSCELLTIIMICHDRHQLQYTRITKERTIKFTGLAKFTKYLCKALVRNSIGNSTWSSTINFITDPAAPAPPTNLTITDIESDQFTIKWQPPDDVDVTGYRISIENLGPANHIVHESCLNPTNFTTIVNVTDTVNNYTFTKAFPDFHYSVNLSAINDYGASDNVSTSIITEISRSEMVENVTIHEIDRTENNTIQLEIRWEEPCNSNGPLVDYTVTFVGKYQNPADYNGTDIRTITQRENFLTLNDLHPGFEYIFTIFAVGLNKTEGESNVTTYKTQDGVPNPPIIQNITDPSPGIFEIFWMDAYEKFGVITNYTIDIEVKGPAFDIPENCPTINYTEHFRISVAADSHSLQFKDTEPYFSYIVKISAATTAGFGEPSYGTPHRSPSATPEPIRSLSIKQATQQLEIYNESATIRFKPSCRPNGALLYYNLKMIGTRHNHDNHNYSKKINETSVDVDLKPDYNYTIEVTVFNEEFQSAVVEIRYHSVSGVPGINQNYSPEVADSTDSPTTVFLTFSKDLFDDSYSGDIHYYAIFLLPGSLDLPTNYGFWSHQWPIDNLTENIRQLTVNYWNPFVANISEVEVKIGGDDDEDLDEDTEYSIIIRGLTENTYRNSDKINFKTGIEAISIALVLGIIFGVLIIVALFISFIVYKKHYQRKLIKDKPISISTIDINKFIPHYQNLTKNSNILKTEFQSIETKSKEFNLPITYAVLPENRRKNRYTNILPFDSTRVKLQQIDEDDEISSDYINASYIRGYSNAVEYIATQGPTEATCRDFWKMVLQENVTIVVMLSQFIEQNKEKCHRYFPNNNERLILNDNFEVRCLTELDFGNYCVRTLQVKKENIQRTLTHLQYLEWPDFGVPSSTDSMLQFCYQIRERIGNEGGLIVVHCSAGVGRTGTLITIDILLQTIDNEENIDIFKTVLNLRQQRINMVQTEKQYMFIYSCIKDFLENPAIKTVKNEEPIYENLAIKSELDDKLIAIDLESSF